MRAHDTVEDLTVEIVRIEALVQVHDFNGRFVVQNVQEALASVCCHVDTCAIGVLCVVDAALVVADDFCCLIFLFLIDFGEETVESLHCDEALLDAFGREDDLDEALDVGIFVILIEFQEEELLHVFELCLVLDELLEHLLVLLVGDLQEVEHL